MRLLLIDFDSFVYNLAQAFGGLGAEPVVMRNDVPLQSLDAIHPDAVVISPGPGRPEDAGVSLEAVAHFGSRVPVLGVCLGHQCIASVYGWKVERSIVGPMHGKTSPIDHDGTGLFDGLPSPLTATRYHSLAVTEPVGGGDQLRVTARSDDGVVMGIRHEALPVEGVQFHPESILSEDGDRLLENFLAAVR